MGGSQKGIAIRPAAVSEISATTTTVVAGGITVGGASTPEAAAASAAVPGTGAADAAAASGVEAPPTVIPPATTVVVVAEISDQQLDGLRSPSDASPKVPTSPSIRASTFWPYQATEAGADFDGPFL